MNWKFDFSPVTSAMRYQYDSFGCSLMAGGRSEYVHMMDAALVDCLSIVVVKCLGLGSEAVEHRGINVLAYENDLCYF